MANIKIAQLTNKTTLSDTDIIIVENATQTMKMTVGNLKNILGINAGGIVESGSNSDGSYVKFGDGTMICWAVKTVSLTGTGAGSMVTLPYPASFSGQPVGGFGGASSAGLISVNRQLQPKISVGTGSGSTGWVIGTEDSSAVGISATLGFYAIGRWKS